MANALSINGSNAIINPTPLISFSVAANQNKLGYLGASYTITLSGAIVWTGNVNTSTKVFDDPASGQPAADGLAWIVETQAKITNLFTKEVDTTEGLTIEIQDSQGNQDKLKFKKCRVESINFEEGTYINLCRYTVVLTSEAMYNGNDTIHEASEMYLYEHTGESYPAPNAQHYLLEDFQEDWDISFDDDFASSPVDNGLIIKPRTYTITRTVTATARLPAQKYNSNVTLKPAWIRARDFLANYILENDSQGDTEQNVSQFIAQNLLGFENSVANRPNIYNHGRTQQVNKAAGSVTVVDTWVLATVNDVGIESYELSINSDSQEPFVKVSINGTIRGLTTWQADDEYNEENNQANSNYSPINQARQKWMTLSNGSEFGVGSTLYKRANNAVQVELNSQPLSVSMSVNEIKGEITYNLEFDNRPIKYFKNALYENITINDTSPGDQFAVIPVIGRSTGPILQFTFGRTEYRRSVNIEVQLDYTDLAYFKNSSNLIHSKPSQCEPMRTELSELLSHLSPANEAGIRRWFMSAPQESWSPKTGRYSLSIEWVYELNV